MQHRQAVETRDQLHIDRLIRQLEWRAELTRTELLSSRDNPDYKQKKTWGSQSLALADAALEVASRARKQYGIQSVDKVS